MKCAMFYCKLKRVISQYSPFSILLNVNHRFSRYRMAGSYLVSVKNVSPQNGGFIRATELVQRLFAGNAKPFIVLKLTRICLLHKESD